MRLETDDLVPLHAIHAQCTPRHTPTTIMMTTLATTEYDERDAAVALTLQELGIEPMVADEDLGDGDQVCR